jgi:tRNA uridine 5-carboxymethylaminomethyl modification enzyme
MRLSGRPPLVLGRAEAYIGVLIDDLTTLGTKEPYRMFTSRAEHRLVLRHDTADSRLGPRGREAGLVDDERWERLLKKSRAIDAIQELLRQRKVPAPGQAEGTPAMVSIAHNAVEKKSAVEILRPHAGESLERCLADSRVELADILPFAPELGEYPKEWLERVRLDIKYAGYIEKEKRAAARAARMDAIKLRPDTNYDSIAGLSAEAREKLKKVKPLTVGQAARIPGLRQGDIALLMVLSRK